MIRRLDSDRDRKQFERFLAQLFAAPTTEILNRLAELNVPSPYRLRIKVIYSPEALEPLLAQKEALGLVHRLSPSALAFRLRERVGRHQPRHVESQFVVLPTEYPHMFAAVSVATTPQWQIVSRLLRTTYPKLVPVFLSQKELIKTVYALRRRNLNFELRVREISAREPILSGGRKRIKSIREWTNEHLEEVLEHVGDRRQTITSLGLSFQRRLGDQVDVSPSLLCRITKWGELDVTSGFRLAWNVVVDHVASFGAEKLTFYRGRGLRERQYRAAPLEIRFKAAVFDRVEEVRRLVETIGRFPRSMHTIQHGNPYAHLTVVDLYDGSGFELWAVTPDAIAILPRLKASEAAVERLVHYVFDSFREGEVVEYGAEPRGDSQTG